MKDPAPAIVEAWPAPWLGWNPTTADHCISGGAGQCPIAWPRGCMWGPRLASRAQTPGAVKLQSPALQGLICRLPRVRFPASSKMTRPILGAPSPQQSMCQGDLSKSKVVPLLVSCLQAGSSGHPAPSLGEWKEGWPAWPGVPTPPRHVLRVGSWDALSHCA